MAGYTLNPHQVPMPADNAPAIRPPASYPIRPGKQTGRPPKITQEQVDRILELVKAGNYPRTACHTAGVDPNAVGVLLHRYKVGRVHAQHLRQLCKGIIEGAGLAEAEALVKATSDGATGARWFLERRFPDRWGKRDYMILDARVIREMPESKLDELLATASQRLGMDAEEISGGPVEDPPVPVSERPQIEGGGEPDIPSGE